MKPTSVGFFFMNSEKIKFFILLFTPMLWGLSIGPLPELIPTAVCWGFFSLLIFSNPPKNLPKTIAYAWFSASLIHSIAVIVQFLNINLFKYQWIFISRKDHGYVDGIFNQPNLTSTFLCIGIICLFFLNNHSKLNNFISILSSIILGTACSILSSRTFLIESVILILILIFSYFRKKNKYSINTLIFVATGYISTSIFIYFIDDRNIIYRIAEDVSCNSRFYLWLNTLELIKEKPLIGWGWSSENLLWAQYITDFKTKRYCGNLGNAHNIFLQLIVTIGIPAALAIIVILFTLIKRLSPFKEEDPYRKMLWLIILVVFIHSNLELPLWSGYFQFISLTCLISLLNKDLKFLKLFSISIFLFSIYLTRDYLIASQAYLPYEYRMEKAKNAKSTEQLIEFGLKTNFFKKEALFAWLSAIDLNTSNAAEVFLMADYLIKYNPEPRVIIKLIDSAKMTDRNDIAFLHDKLFSSRYPQEYINWKLSID